MNYNTSISSGKEVNKTNPCPLCNKTDWCLQTSDLSAVICGRIDPGSEPTGWYFTGKNSRDGRPIFRQGNRLNCAVNQSSKQSKENKFINGVTDMKTASNEISNISLSPNQIADIKIAKASGKEVLGKLIKGKSFTSQMKASGINLWTGADDNVTEYHYSATQTLYRIDPVEGKKRFYQVTNTVNGLKAGNQGNPFKAYPMDIIDSLQADEWIVMVEGEKCVDTVVSQLGLKAFTVQTWSEDVLRGTLQAIKGKGVKGVVFIPDNDEVGLKKATEVEGICGELTLLSVVLPLNPLAAEFKIDYMEHSDIVDLTNTLLELSMNVNTFIEALEREIHQSLKQKYLIAEGFSPSEVNQGSTPSVRGVRLTGQAKLANDFLATVGDNLAYDGKTEQWYSWNGKHWEVVKKDDVSQLVIQFCEDNDIDYKSDSNLNGTVSLVSKKIRQKQWKKKDLRKFIPFQNGYLNLKTKELIKDFGFFKRYGYTHCLPYDYPENIELTGNVLEDLKKYHNQSYEFLMKAQGNNEQAVMKCLSVVSGVITGTLHDSQMFVLALGKPATGKTTFSKLVAACLGQGNYAKRKIHHLGQKFGLSGLSNVRLILFGDEENIKRGSKEAGIIKDFVGDDEFYEEQKYKDGQTVKKDCAAWINANEDPIPEYDPAIERRKCTIRFDNQIPVEERRHDYLDELTSDLGNFIAVILSIPEKTVINYLKGINEGKNTDSRHQAWLERVNNDPIAAWMEENISFNSECSESLGNSLYKSFKGYCEESGMNQCTLQAFSKGLMNLAESQGYKLTKTRSASGYRINGVKIKDLEDSTISEKLKVSGEKNMIVPLTESVENVEKPTLMHTTTQTHVDFSEPSNPYPVKVSVENVENVDFFENSKIKDSEVEIKEPDSDNSLSTDPKFSEGDLVKFQYFTRGKTHDGSGTVELIEGEQVSVRTTTNGIVKIHQSQITSVAKRPKFTIGEDICFLGDDGFICGCISENENPHTISMIDMNGSTWENVPRCKVMLYTELYND